MEMQILKNRIKKKIYIKIKTKNINKNKFKKCIKIRKKQ